jgi:hypothetical protein
VGTGALERSIQLEVTDTGVQVTIDPKIAYNPRYGQKLFRPKDIKQAVDRALRKWLDGVIELA